MSGKRIGYIRVSTIDQNPDRQLEGLNLDKKFIEHASGTTIKRPILQSLIEYVREEDQIYVHSLDRLARNARDLTKIIETVVEKGCEIHFIKESLKFNKEKNPMANLLLGVFGHLAEFEHSLIKERLLEGVALAKKAGKYKGGRSKFTKELKEKLIQALETRESKRKIAKRLGISRFSLYKYIKMIAEKDSLTWSCNPQA